MSEYLTEEEKVEAIRDWWKENGRYVIAGVVLGIAALLGWRGWEDYRERQAEQASQLYAELEKAATTQKAEDAVALAQRLREDYAATPYAVLAALQVARLESDKQDYPAAAESLRWAVDHTDQDAHRALAQLRLARVLLAQQQAEEALQLLEKEPFAASFDGLVAELRGDALRALGRTDDARRAYDEAIGHMAAKGGGGAEYLRMKRGDLGAALASAADSVE